MIIDKEMFLSEGQAVTASAASVNTINAGAGGDAYGNELFFVARVGKAFVGAGTLSISIQTAPDAAFASPATLYSSGALPAASLPADTVVVKAKMPLGAKKYIRAFYTVGGGSFTAGTIDAFFTPDVDVE